MPVGPSILWPVNDGEVDAEVADVDRQVRDGLAGVEHGEGADRAGPLDEPSRPG